MPRSSRLALLALAVAARALAAPQGWSASFSPEAVRAAFRDGPVAVVPGAPAAVGPAAALAEALRRSSRPLQVLEAPRAPAAGWSDERAVEAAPRAADQVAVVRVYQGAGGALVGTVALYGRDRAPLRAFYVVQGQAAIHAPALPSGGASPVDDVSRYRNVDEAFVRAHYLDFTEQVALRNGVKVAEIATPFRGDQQQHLWWDEFYRTVGRDDLAGRSAALGSLKLTLGLGALGCAAATLVGGLITFATLSSTYEPGLVGPVLGLGGLLGASVLGLWSASIQPMVLGMEENRQLADEYNQRLKRGEIHGGRPAPAPGIRLSLLPAQGGLALRASF